MAGLSGFSSLAFNRTGKTLAACGSSEPSIVLFSVKYAGS